ncbi:PP2C family serine/threonine-protein phosphatase [Cutibacterium sp.]|uniref:PP2C family protein-serine/threonine phosphatase n=1 Tax=Cutibacterium sp. TaxID=1912221 RepID=UPI0026DBC196|nr:PP2C family serine/threonine-protein phosphatase [Cutibacterium sp.]MDO4412076.1 serine/threonine-protein phosphatase [Cutibacterium sp.]
MNESDQSAAKIVTPDTSAITRVDLTDEAAARDDLACASHIGLHHDTNQDAAALGIDSSGRHVVLVVADGVSSTQGAEECARIASHTARDYLTATMGQGMPDNDNDVVALFERAFRKTHEAVVNATPPVGACTLAVAVATPERIVVGNIGDTRTYWFPDGGDCIRLSIDDSVAQAQMDLGMPREEAEAGPGAHAITKWVGACATDLAPRVVAYQPQHSGWLLVCSDGLWNHVPDPDDFTALIADLVSTARHNDQGRPDPEGLAAGLIRYANSCGGHDNITVALWRRDA